MAEVLADEVVDQEVPEAWERDGDEIVRTYEFDEYLDAAAFLGEIAELAEEEWHHPEMTLTYGEVEVRFTTHEAGGITEQDIQMAELFEGEY
ncbi:MAG: 4a-hydroxytetrahydrobiopterin dehydratase [Halolamina sp.]|uniref:4a-hydroxytetrahydrobiopterin dehydratase n=1 Tax=Halolamina sp. TaxID=1940283 RepID=UPI002FC2C39D